MAEGAKRAHADLNITVEGPREELDVVTERPRDLSPAVELEMNRNKSLVDALGHLGNIADNANDLNRTINAYDWDVDYKDRADEMRIEQRRLEETAQLNLFNDVSATKVQMMKDVENAKEAARNSGEGNVLAAAQGAMDGYRDAFSDSLEGSKMWSQVFNNTYAHETQYGILSDFEIAQAKAMHNINQSQNEIFRNVTMGTLDVDSGMKKLLVDTGAMKGRLPNQKYVEMMDTNYNQLVIAKALNLSKVANGSNATEVANTIRSLINQYGKKEYACFDNQGKALTDEHGNPITYTASLTPATIEELLRTAQSYENKASSSGSGGATKTFEGYKDYVEGKDLEENGVSSYMMSTDSISAKRDYETLMQNIDADETRLPRQKLEEKRKVSDYYWTIVQPSVAVHEAMQLTPNSRLNHGKLRQKLAELNAALDSKQNMLDYSMSFDMDGGKTFELKPAIDYSLMGSSDKVQAAHNMWETIRDTMQKTLQAETSSDFMFGTNYHYTQEVKSSMSALNRNSLLTSNGVNDSAVTSLTNNLLNVRYSYVDAVGDSGTYNSLPKQFVTEFMKQYTNCTNPRKQSDYARAVATALVNSGFSGSILEPAVNQGTDAEKIAAANLQKEMYLSAPGLSGIRAYVSHSANQGKGQYTLDVAKEYLSKQNLGTTKSGEELSGLTEEISRLMDAHKIPVKYQESLMSTLANVAMDMAIVDKNPPSDASEKALLYKGDIKKALDTIVKANFIDIDSPYVSSSVHIGNPALLQGNKTKMANHQASVIGSMVTEVGDTIHNTLNSMGHRTPKNRIAAELDSISGRITFKKDGDKIGISDEVLGIYGSSIGIPYNYMAAKPKTFSDVQWKKEVTDYVSVSTALAMVAEDKPSAGSNFMGTKDTSKLTDPLTKKRIDKQVTSADAIRMLSVLQSDDFLQKYSDTVNSDGKIGVSPAPRYIKDMFKRDVLEKKTVLAPHIGLTETTVKAKSTPENINNLLDFAYSKSVTHNKIDLTVNKPLSYDMQGMNFTGVITAAHNNGYHINRDYDLNQYGNYISNHAKGMALDFGVYSNNMEDNLTGRVKVDAMRNFTDMLTKNPAYAKKVSRVLTSRPELLENKPEYAAYAPFRALKNSEGKPLFQDARESDRKYGLNHKNHFHVDFKEQVVDSKGKDFINAFPALAEDMANTASKSHTPLSNKEAKALLYAFGDRFGQQPNSKGQFGMANLTEAEYSMLGMNKSLLQDPTIQARAMANRYQAYSNALGNTDLAIYALAGAKFRTQENKTVTIQEILNSGKIAGINGTKYYLALPMKDGKLDAAEQARQNALHRKYKKALKN